MNKQKITTWEAIEFAIFGSWALILLGFLMIALVDLSMSEQLQQYKHRNKSK